MTCLSFEEAASLWVHTPRSKYPPGPSSLSSHLPRPPTTRSHRNLTLSLFLPTSKTWALTSLLVDQNTNSVILTRSIHSSSVQRHSTPFRIEKTGLKSEWHSLAMAALSRPCLGIDVSDGGIVGVQGMVSLRTAASMHPAKKGPSTTTTTTTRISARWRIPTLILGIARAGLQAHRHFTAVMITIPTSLTVPKDHHPQSIVRAARAVN